LTFLDANNLLIVNPSSLTEISSRPILTNQLDNLHLREDTLAAPRIKLWHKNSPQSRKLCWDLVKLALLLSDTTRLKILREDNGQYIAHIKLHSTYQVALQFDHLSHSIGQVIVELLNKVIIHAIPEFFSIFPSIFRTSKLMTDRPQGFGKVCPNVLYDVEIRGV
jgi:hypothetical protein